MTSGATSEGGDRPRIVVGVDGSAGGTGALDWAVAEAERTGAVLDVHTVYAPGYVFVTAEEIQMAMDKVIEGAVERVAELAPSVPVGGTTHEGSAAAVLIEASRGASLLVVGSRGGGGFAGLALGSVSQQCAQHAHCPVVIVHHGEQAA
jgi:nucleotide-binding universal stress UspA family protein